MPAPRVPTVTNRPRWHRDSLRWQPTVWIERGSRRRLFVQVQATRQGQFLVPTSLDRRSTVSGPVEKKVLAAGPARDVYRLYAEADRPQLEVLAKTIADDDALPGAPGKDLIGKIISGDGLSSGKDAVTVTVVQAWIAGREGQRRSRRRSACCGSRPQTAPPARSSSTRLGTAGPSPLTSATRTTEQVSSGPSGRYSCSAASASACRPRLRSRATWPIKALR